MKNIEFVWLSDIRWHRNTQHTVKTCEYVVRDHLCFMSQKFYILRQFMLHINLKNMKHMYKYFSNSVFY